MRSTSRSRWWPAGSRMPVPTSRSERDGTPVRIVRVEAWRRCASPLQHPRPPHLPPRARPAGRGSASTCVSGGAVRREHWDHGTCERPRKARKTSVRFAHVSDFRALNCSGRTTQIIEHLDSMRTESAAELEGPSRTVLCGVFQEGV